MIIVIIGPTASGKSQIALKVAKHFHGVIVSFDAFQLYRDFRIGVNAPSIKELQEVKHYFVNEISPNQSYSINDYQKAARGLIDQLLKKEIPIIMVGGSGLYLKATLFDYQFHEKTTPNSDFSGYSNEQLHDLLKQIDPEDAAKIHVNNRQRLLRALEIYEETKQSKSEYTKNKKNALLYDDVHFFFVKRSREELYRTINDRVDEMTRQGLFLEAETLKNKYPHMTTASKAIGYKEIFDNPDLEAARIIDLIKKHTRNYAKRQDTFFRHQFKTVTLNETQNSSEIVDYLENKIK
ncbi:MAG: tRNA (adenosine(37)-N6)-dimethylallyltransferase MiaA [Erysipelotrichaceae bacterium]|jgi:tRNA dimethylallyltransferase|nr:tRNA (adenosine(37)-N6)-dimethylallyltransferase MiaA [Erysipelotrichaceae bacterium]